MQAFREAHPAFCSQLEAGRAYGVLLLNRIHRSTSRNTTRTLMRKFFSSEFVRWSYAYDILKERGELSGHTPETIMEICRRIDPRTRSTEQVGIVLKCRGGKVRRTLKFGTVDKATQRLVADAIRAAHPSREWQYTFCGVQAALKAVGKAVEAGNRYGVEVDVSNFYPSVTLKMLHMAIRRLPRAVTDNTVWTGMQQIATEQDGSLTCSIASEHDHGDPFGLAQGSACSAAAGEALLGMTLAKLPDNVVVVNYADNIYLLAGTRLSVQAGIESLVELLGDLPSGSLAIHCDPEILDMKEDYIRFLGCEGHWNAASNSLVWEPTEAARGAIEEEIDNATSTPQTIQRAMSRVRAWRAICEDWPERDNWAFTHLAELEAKSAICNGEHVAQSAKRIIAYWERTNMLMSAFDILPPLPENNTNERERFVALVEQLAILRLQRSPTIHLPVTYTPAWSCNMLQD